MWSRAPKQIKLDGEARGTDKRGERISLRLGDRDGTLRGGGAVLIIMVRRGQAAEWGAR